MKLLSLVTIATLAVLAAGYDFQDEVYNQLIKQDLDDLDSYPEVETFVNYRRKREEVKPVSTTTPTPHVSKTQDPQVAKDPKFPKPEEPTPNQDKCKRKRTRMCCGEELVDGVMEKDKDLKKECYKEVTGMSKEEKPFGTYDPFNCDKVNKTKREWACVMQCVGQKKNVIDEDGKVKEKETMEYYKKEFGKEEWFFKLIDTAFPKCLEQSKNVTGFVKNKEDHLSCNPAGMKLHHCMWREMQLGCPEDKIVDQKTCGKIREKIKKHDDVPFRHVHAGHVHDDDK